MNQKLLTVQEVAEILNISRESVRNMLKRGDIPATRVLSEYRISADDLEIFIKRGAI